MDHAKKLDFVLKMTRHALDSVQHFDQGGVALPAPGVAGAQNAVDPSSQGIAGAVSGFLGTNNNFRATGAPIQAGTTGSQLNTAYQGAQGALGQAGNLAGTLTPGVAQGAGSQGFLTNQLMQQAQGGGPNPAQAALNQNTGQNIAQQAALMAGQRGAGSNAGLLASQAAQQGANIQQNAIGQGATLQAQQQLAAQNSLSNLANSQISQGSTAVQLANQTQQNEQNILQGANTATNNQNVSMQGNINSTNAQVAAGNQNSNQNTIKGVGNAVNSIGAGLGLFAEGGQVPGHIDGMARIYHPHYYAEGGVAWQPSQIAESPIQMQSNSALPEYKGDWGKSDPAAPKGQSGPQVPGGLSDLNMPELGAGMGGAAPSLGVEGVGASAAGPSLMSAAALALSKGGQVPGKPKVGHDDYSNDTVDAKLTPGEVVIDLNTLNDKGKLGQMARFVANNIERKKAGRKLK